MRRDTTAGSGAAVVRRRAARFVGDGDLGGALHAGPAGGMLRMVNVPNDVRRSDGKGAVVATATVTGAAARRERNRREMREAILGAARRIVNEQGAEALTMRAIGQAIGYSAPALYEYFPAKEDLYGCLYFEGSGGLAGRMRETLAGLPAGASALERIFALGHAYRAFAHEQPDLFRLVLGQARPEFSEGFTPPAADQQAEEEEPEGTDAFALLVGVAQDGIERGEFAAMPPVAIAIAAWTMVHGFVILELNGHLSTDGAPSLEAMAAAKAMPTTDELFATTLRLCAEGMVRR